MSEIFEGLFAREREQNYVDEIRERLHFPGYGLQDGPSWEEIEEARENFRKREIQRTADNAASRAARDLLESDGLKNLIASMLEKRLNDLIENEGESLIYAVEQAKKRKADYMKDVAEIVFDIRKPMELHNYVLVDDYCFYLRQADTGSLSTKTRSLLYRLEGDRYDTHNLYSIEILEEIRRNLRDDWDLITDAMLRSMGYKGRADLYKEFKLESSFHNAFSGVCVKEGRTRSVNTDKNSVSFWILDNGYIKSCTLFEDGKYNIESVTKSYFYSAVFAKKAKTEEDKIYILDYVAKRFLGREFVIKYEDDRSYASSMKVICDGLEEKTKNVLFSIAEKIRDEYKTRREEMLKKRI